MVHRETIYRLMGASFLNDISKRIIFYTSRSRRISCSSEALSCYLKRYSKFSQSKALSEDGVDIIFDKFSEDAVDQRKLGIKF